MKTDSCCAEKSRCTAYVLGILGTFLLMAGLVWLMRHYTQPAPLGAERALERIKNLKEMRAADFDAVNNYGWQDQAKGLVRLPVARAMEITLQEWQNPAAARADLIARMEKATAPAPKAPEKPSPFE
ncbi:MAG: hypothetical protein ABJC04_07880 [Verrucomicrobiota bacterium]